MAERQLVFSRIQGGRALHVWANTEGVTIRIEERLTPSEIVAEQKVRCVETSWTHAAALRVAHGIGPHTGTNGQRPNTVFHIKIGDVEFPLAPEYADKFAGSIYWWMVDHGYAPHDQQADAERIRPPAPYRSG